MTKKIKDNLLRMMSDVAEVVIVPEGDKELLNKELKDAHVLLLSTAFKIDSEILRAAPKLEVISRTGVGVDNVDIQAASERNILVLNTPGANAISVAEHTIALMLALEKQLFLYDHEMRKGNFDIRRSSLSSDIQGKTLGLIGCGGIGRLVAEKCIHAFGMKVIGYDPFITGTVSGIELKEHIDDVFKEADFISLHIPLTEETRNLVDERLLRLMKNTAFILNTSRGGIVDEDALERVLREKTIKGAALDVFAEEPVEEDRSILELDNLIVTPHSAALTKECTYRVASDAVQGIMDYLEGKEPKYIFNKKLINI